jgi:hypothetical protein
MPTVRAVSAAERESIREEATATGLKGEAARLATNAQLADYMGKFIAGELMKQYEGQNLADVINNIGKQALRLSWG